MQSVKHIQRVYYAAISLFWLATALPMALMILLFQARGFSLLEIGLATAVYSATIVLLEVPTGGLADAVGRKRVALLAYGLMALMSLVLLLAFTMPVMILGMVLYGASRALSSGALDAWFVDALQAADPAIDLQPALAQAGVFTLLALGVGAFVGSGLPQLFGWLPAEGTAVITPLAIPILFALVVKLALFVFVAVAVQEEWPTDNAGSWRDGLRTTPRVVGDAFRLTRHNRTILLLLGTSVVGGLALTGVETFWQPQMAHLLGDPDANTLLFGLAMAGSFLAGMGGNMVATPLGRLFKRRYALVAALVRGLQGLLLVGLAWQTAVPAFVIFFWLVYLNLGVLDSPHNTLLNTAIPAGRRSAMLSIASLASYVGSMVGSIALGFLAQQASIRAAWIVAGVALMVSLLLYLRIDVHQQRSERSYEPEPAIFEIREEANFS